MVMMIIIFICIALAKHLAQIQKIVIQDPNSKEDKIH